MGKQQAKQLTTFFTDKLVDQIISSPFIRAQETIKWVANKQSLPVQLDDRLSERVLSTVNLSDWIEKLKATFSDRGLTFSGGESSEQATARIYQVVDELDDYSRTILVTHGNIMSLLLRKFDESIGFKEWSKLTNPDVYKLTITGDHASLERIWEEAKCDE